jgi:hypothetical protein
MPEPPVFRFHDREIRIPRRINAYLSRQGGTAGRSDHAAENSLYKKDSFPYYTDQ